MGSVTQYPPIAMSQVPEQPLSIANQPDPYAVQPNTPIRSEFDYLSRGGISNTVKQGMQEIEDRKRMQLIQRMYEEVIARGEQGARALYADAVAYYGPEIRGWIPQVDGFRDKDGRFSPVEYSKHVAVGVQKFKEEFQKQKEKEIERKGYQAIAPVIEGAGSAREAASGIASQGIDPNKFGQVYDMFPKPVEPITPLEQQLKMSQIDENKAQAERARRETPLVEKDPTFDDAKKSVIAANERYIKAENTLKNLRQQKASMLKQDPTADTQEIDTRMAEWDAELTSAKASKKAADVTLSQLAQSGTSEKRRAHWQGAKSAATETATEAAGKEANELKNAGAPVPDDPAYMQSMIRNKAENMFDPVLAQTVANPVTSGNPVSNSEGAGDPDVIATLQNNPTLWQQYQAADPMSKARMRAKVRAAIDANNTTR